MDDTFKIFVRRLSDGHQEKIQEILDPEFLGIQETGLAFKLPIELTGVAEMTEEMFVLKLDVETEATLPCSICNEGVQVKISISNFFYTKPFSKIKGAVFDYREPLREAILLAVPHKAECGGDCPERAFLAQYLTQSKGDSNHGSTT